MARWEAGDPSRGQGIVLGPEAAWKIENQGGVAVAALVPLNDYFCRAGFELNIDRQPAGPVWLSAAYPDRGYGLVSLAPDVPQGRQWGVARLNTGRLRRAVFRLDRPDFRRPLRIFGAPWLHSLVLTDTEPVREP